MFKILGARVQRRQQSKKQGNPNNYPLTCQSVLKRTSKVISSSFGIVSIKNIVISRETCEVEGEGTVLLRTSFPRMQQN